MIFLFNFFCFKAEEDKKTASDTFPQDFSLADD